MLLPEAQTDGTREPSKKQCYFVIGQRGAERYFRFYFIFFSFFPGSLLPPPLVAEAWLPIPGQYMWRFASFQRTHHANFHLNAIIKKDMLGTAREPSN